VVIRRVSKGPARSVGKVVRHEPVRDCPPGHGRSRPRRA
jgi:hypothetical protein